MRLQMGEKFSPTHCATGHSKVYPNQQSNRESTIKLSLKSIVYPPLPGPFYALATHTNSVLREDSRERVLPSVVSKGKSRVSTNLFLICLLTLTSRLMYLA